MDPLYLGCELLRESFVYYAMAILGYNGQGYFGVPLGLALIAVGYKRQNQHFKLAGVAVLLSIASTGMLIEALKHIFQMPRPRSAGSYAFPSGHSGTAFAIARRHRTRSGPASGRPSRSRERSERLAKAGTRDGTRCGELGSSLFGILL